MSPTEITPAWQPYIDMAEVKRFLQWPSSSSTQDQLLQDTIDAACWWAQDFLSKPVAPTEFFRRFNGYTGWGGSIIDLPYWPVIVDTSYPITVTEYWGASGPHTLTLQTPAAQGTSDMFQLDPLRGLITRSYLGLLQRPFFPGLKNVEVTWWAGYNPIPPTWKRGTLRLIKHWWDHDFQAKLGGFKPAEGGGYEHEFFALVPDDIMSVFSTATQIGIA